MNEGSVLRDLYLKLSPENSNRDFSAANATLFVPLKDARNVETSF